MVDMNPIEQLVETIKQPIEDTNTTYSAVVSKVDNEGTVWVYLAGSDKETPTASSSSEVKRGDSVTVEWRNNKLYIAGNYSNPSAGVERVENVENDALRAMTAANNAQAAATSAEASAAEASAAAAHAKETTDEINAYAETAGKTVTQILNDGETAGTAAQQAKTAADNAMKGLGQVEDVVGTLNWITEHSKVTEDTTPKAGKSYYVKNQDNTFTLVTDVEGKNPAQEGWYELTEAVQNYILSHLALTNDGLYVMKDDSHWRFLIRNDGIYVVDENNIPVNQMGVMGNVVGYETNMHLKMGYDSIDFMDGEDRLGYIGNNKLLFASAEVTNNLYVTDRYVWRKTPQGAMGLYLR